MQYVYLSYPKEDAEFAQRCVDQLQDSGYMVFMDAVSEPGSMAWAAESRRAIRGSGVVILILMPATGRRTGIRLEGIGAKRRGKPVIVIQRSPGEPPRYLQDSPILDGTGDFDTLWAELRAALPTPAALMQAPAPELRPLRRPPRQPEDSLRRRRVTIVVTIVVLALAIAIGLGWFPM